MHLDRALIRPWETVQHDELQVGLRVGERFERTGKRSWLVIQFLSPKHSLLYRDRHYPFSLKVTDNRVGIGYRSGNTTHKLIRCHYRDGSPTGKILDVPGDKRFCGVTVRF